MEKHDSGKKKGMKVQKIHSAEKQQSIDLQKMLEQVDEQDNKPRELQKFKYWEGQPDKNKASIEDDDSSEPFDQFKGKQSTYNWELYSTKLPPESSIPLSQQQFAEQLERELFDERRGSEDEENEELMFSAVRTQTIGQK